MFLLKDDLRTIIRNNLLDEITSWDDTVFDASEVEAESVVASYLSARYDTDTIFAAVGDARHTLILMLVKDVLCYNLHTRLNPRKIPKHRITRYEHAIDMLKGIQLAEINPPGLPLPVDGSKSYFANGGNPQRNNQY